MSASDQSELLILVQRARDLLQKHGLGKLGNEAVAKTEQPTLIKMHSVIEAGMRHD